MYKGISASPGIGIGSVCRIVEADLSYDNKKIDDIDGETIRFEDALETFKVETRAMADDVKERIGKKEAEILEGHLIMIEDPSMSGEMKKMIASGQCAESAVEAVCDMFYGMFSKMDDEMMRQRASDIADIKVSLLKILLGIKEVDISAVPAGTVLVARDLTPSMTSRIVKGNVVGIITEIGGKTSHSAILARALEIPAVLSIPGITDIAADKDAVIVDGIDGNVYLNPDGEILSRYLFKREEYIKLQKELRKFIGKKTLTKTGDKVDLFCNIGTDKDAKQAVECDGEGIGLFRSEFLYMNESHLPTVEEQFEAYSSVVKIMRGKPVIIRTLDIGGDKAIDYLKMNHEDNPFLGYRAVRYCLGNPDIYKIQLKAILRASAFGPIKIMVPLVTCVEELRSVKKLVEICKEELTKEGHGFDKNIEVGCMIETASASLIADLLAKEADFFSIGTNDLTQYTMSVDRGNPDVAYLYSAFQPSVLRSIRHIISCAKEAGIPVGMCGEAAGDPMMVPLLLSFGLDEYSVNPTRVLTVRSILSKWNKEDADELAEKIMELATEEEVVAALEKAMR